MNRLQGESSGTHEKTGMMGRSSAIWRSPSTKVMIAGVDSTFSSGLAPNQFTGDSKGYGDEVCLAGHRRHNGGVNVAYLDGHASWEKCAAVAAPWHTFVLSLAKWQVNAE